MGIVTHAARTLLAADGVTFVLRDGDRCYYAEEDAISPLWKGKRFPMGASISGWCMTERQAVAIPDIYQDFRIPIDAYRATFVRSLAMVPVREDDPIAAMGAYWSQLRNTSPGELDLLQTIANSAALGIAKIELEHARRALTLPRRRHLRGDLEGGSPRSTMPAAVCSGSPRVVPARPSCMPSKRERGFQPSGTVPEGRQRCRRVDAAQEGWDARRWR
jgi:GAF domain-containing protein